MFTPALTRPLTDHGILTAFRGGRVRVKWV